MMVLSQLQFRKYLDNQVDPISAAATRLLPRPTTLGKPDGDFDVLIISRQYGPLSMCGSNRYRCRCGPLSLCRQFRVVLWPRHLYTGSDCNHPKTLYGAEN
nr:hypothetical protein BaRGS_001834 [Batillaria attramentaria]